MLCAGLVSVAGAAAGVLGGLGPARGRPARAHAPRARPHPGRAVVLPDGAVRVRDRGVAIDLALEPGGRRRRGREPPRRLDDLDPQAPGRRARGRSCSTGGGPRSRRPDWSTTPPGGTRGARHGTGPRAPGGRPTGGRSAWNLVAGVHDAPVRSERTVWVDGVAQEAGPVRVRRGPRHRRRPALRRRGRARAATTASASASSRASTASRSARSPARCPAASRWRTAGVSWSAIAHAGERREAGTQRPIGPAEGGEPWPPRWPRCAA